MNYTCLILCVAQFFSLISQPSVDFKKPAPKIYGKWVLISCSGGFTGKGPGWDLSKNITFEYSSSGKFKRTESGKAVEQDKFVVKKASTIFSTLAGTMLDFKKLNDQVYKFSGDSLFISENVNDGFSYVLIKKK